MHDVMYDSFSLNATPIHCKVTAVYYNDHDFVFEFVIFKLLRLK